MAEEIIIHDLNWQQYLGDPVVDGDTKARGLIPRDYKLYPPGYYKAEKAFSLPLIPRSEWPERIRDMEQALSRLSDIRNRGNPSGGPIPSRDQNGRGYCWNHSPVSAAILIRARDNQPYLDLSAYAGACIIKAYRDEGGWGALGLDWMIENGCPTSEFWPQQGTSRSLDTPEMRANAKLHQACETWMEAGAPYDRNLTFDQVFTALLLRMPGPGDFNWWRHSVALCDPVHVAARLLRMETGKKATLKEMEQAYGATDGFGIRIWNSWGDGWSDNGMGVLTGSKAIPDGACMMRTVEVAAS